MIISKVEQGSPEWLAERAGHPTASNFGKIITPTTQKPSAQAEKYLYTLAGERIAGPQPETYKSVWMERGLEIEAEARDFFSLVKDVEIQEVGLVYRDKEKLWSCSPDGLVVGGNIGLEIKCPAMHTHVGYLLAGTLPTEYIAQVQGSMFICTYFAWWFLSYYPGLPPFILKVERDKKFVAALKIELDTFCEKLDTVETKLRALE